MNERIWGEVTVNSNGQLENDLECDVLVIGGGIAGYLCAYYLQNNYKVVLVEKDTLFSKTTHKTTAFITPYQGAIYYDLMKKYGEKVAKGYYQSQLYAIRKYKRLIENYNIDCDFEKSNGFLYTKKINQTWKNELHAYVKLQIGYEHVKVDDDVINSKAEEIIQYQDSPYQFNPIKFLNGLKTSFDIYEHTNIKKIDHNNNTVYTHNNKTIKAGKIIVATNFPIIDIPGYYFAKMYRSVSYAGFVKVDKPLLGQFTGTDDSDYYFRNYQDMVVFGGLDHKTGMGSYDDHYRVMIRENYPNNHIVVTYNTIDSMTFDRIPFIGQLANKDIYVVTGFSKYGMTNSMLAAQIIKDDIEGIENPYAFVVSPKRHYISSNFFTFAYNMITSVYYIGKQFIGIPLKGVYSLKPNSGDVIIFRGKKLAVYKDSEGRLHTFSSRCTHLNCQLKWNSTAKCFECPCHGSRYDIHGKVIYEPAAHDKVEKEYDSK